MVSIDTIVARSQPRILPPRLPPFLPFSRSFPPPSIRCSCSMYNAGFIDSAPPCRCRRPGYLLVALPKRAGPPVARQGRLGPAGPEPGRPPAAIHAADSPPPLPHTYHARAHATPTMVHGRGAGWGGWGWQVQGREPRGPPGGRDDRRHQRGRVGCFRRGGRRQSHRRRRRRRRGRGRCAGPLGPLTAACVVLQSWVHSGGPVCTLDQHGTGILVSFLPPHFRPNTSGSSFKIQKSSLFGIIDGHRPSSVDF